MEDITNTFHETRIGTFARHKPDTGLSQEPAVPTKLPAAPSLTASQHQKPVRQVNRYGRILCDSTDLVLSRRQGDLSASLHDSPSCEGPSGGKASQLLHISGGAVRGRVARPHSESRDTMDQSVANSLVLQDATAQLNTVTRNLELEGNRLQDSAHFFPFFEQKLGGLEKVCG